MDYMAENRFKDKRVTVMGLGSFGGGVGAVKFFCDRGARVTVTDLKEEAALADSLEKISSLDVTLHLGGHPGTALTAADIVCVNPAVKPTDKYLEAARMAEVEVVTEMGLFFELFPGRIIGVTGSNGKSTTAKLLYTMLEKVGKVHLGGNIGYSLLPDIDSFTPEDTAVLELSSFQLKRLDVVGRSPDTAIITNITPNHLDWHRTYEEYVAAKGLIAAFQSEDDILIIDSEDSDSGKIASGSNAGVIQFGKKGERSLRVTDDSVVFRSGGTDEFLFKTADVKLPGFFNMKNAAMAACAAFLNGADAEMISLGLSSFELLPHRLAKVVSAGGVDFYDDSVSTTPESTIAAAEALPGNSVFILGGYDKGINLKPAVKAVVKNCGGIICIGDMGTWIEEYARKKAPSSFPVEKAETLEDAVTKAYTIVSAKGEGAVVLSPACASYDMFENYVERGDLFVKYAKQFADSKPDEI